jgi:hypothetical protein
MNETEKYGFTGVRSGDTITLKYDGVSVGESEKFSLSDPNYRDRMIEFIEDRADSMTDGILEELGINTEDEEDYDQYNTAGDDD